MNVKMNKISRSYLIPIGLLALLTIMFFAPVLFSGTTFLPIGSDFINFNFPNDMFGAQSLQQGDIPLWNPYIANGQPYGADPNIGFFYPLRILLFLFTFNYQWMTYSIIFHYFLAGTFAYFLALDMGVGRWGSFAAGIGYMFAGIFIGQMDHINIIYSSIWLPLVFLLFRRSVLRKQQAYALLAGLILSLSILGGHQQFSLYIGYWCSLWVIFYLIQTRGKGLVPSIISLILLCTVALTASAIQILPTVEFFQHSKRAIMPISEASNYSTPPYGWLLLISPHFFGQNFIEALPFWDIFVNVNEFYMYVGVVLLFAALVGSYVWRNWEKWFLVVVVVLGFLLTSGSVTPVYKLAFQLVPGMQMVRVPSRFVFWVDSALILLAAFGIDWLITKAKDMNDPIWKDVFKILGFGAMMGIIYRIVFPFIPALQVINTHPSAERVNNYRQIDALIFAGFMLAMFVIFMLPRKWPVFGNGMPFLLILLLIIDLFRAQQPRHFVKDDPLEHFTHPEIFAFLQEDVDPYRVDFTNVAYFSGGWNPLTGFLNDYLQIRGLPWNPFDLQTIVDYQDVSGFNSRFYDFRGTKYLVTGDNEKLPVDWQLQLDIPPTLALYENKNFLPRAFMVYSAFVEPNREQALRIIQEEQYDPAETVMLARGDPFTGTPGNGHVEIVKMDNNSLSLTVETDQPGYLVVSDTYYPGWRVSVNGREQEIVRANHAFKALFLDTGQAEVVFQYRSKPVEWGGVISLTVWILVLAGGALWWRKKRRDGL